MIEDLKLSQRLTQLESAHRRMRAEVDVIRTRVVSMIVGALFGLAFAVLFLFSSCAMPLPELRPMTFGGRVERIVFELHPAVETWMAQGGVIAAGEPFVFKQTAHTDDRIDFEASHTHGDTVLLCSVSIRTGSPIADVRFRVSYGGSHVTQPTVPRIEMTAGFWAGGRVEDVVAIDVGGGMMTNGQSAPTVHARFDFSERRVVAQHLTK